MTRRLAIRLGIPLVVVAFCAGAVSAVLAQETAPRAVGPGNAANEGPPRIVAMAPAAGATDVDPATREIVVTFDRDMAPGPIIRPSQRTSVRTGAMCAPRSCP